MDINAVYAQLPHLLPGEKIIRGEDFPSLKKHTIPSSIRALENLTRVTSEQEIGAYGPVRASLALPGRGDQTFHRYDVLFGRDSLRVALNVLHKYPKLARTTLLVLAGLQGCTINDASEEEPGRIVHEVRDPVTDPVAQDLMMQYGWQWPYYGSVDATPEFIRLLAAYCRQTREGAKILRVEFVGRDGLIHTLSDALTHAVAWINGRLDANREGLLEFKRRNPRGIENQVWKDSWDAYFHASGKIANHHKGIASVEVQRVTYDALLDAAELYEEHLNRRQEASQLRERAQRLKQVLMNYFWVNDKGGYFILGTDRDRLGKLRKLYVRASNMGHLLHSRLLEGTDPQIVDRRERVIRQLFSPELMCLNGIRTLASDEVRFRPGAYHNGSCWGWDNYIIAQGLRMHGYMALSDYVEQCIISGVAYAGRFVEFLRGSNDRTYRINTRIVDVWDKQNKRVNRLEQPPQDMQAWTVAAVLSIKLAREKRMASRMAPDKAKRALEHEILSGFGQPS